MSDELVTIEIDGQTLQARPGSMLIDVADAAGIAIPRFCYHKKLSVAASCRMCLVDVEKAPKPLPACATPVTAGMKVNTQSAKTRSAQKDVMEFLLINHPLDCPICDQGGECELQDVSMGYGRVQSEYQEIKRVVADKDIGPLIETAMTRCIHCTRCVRFGEEIAGLRELGATGRSEQMQIGTYVEKALVSELSGNIIDLCPVGALTAKPSRYTARAWELRAHASIAPHDAVGSNIEMHSFDGRIIRTVPRENEAVNECWLSDRDRFSYEGLYSADRLGQPEIKRDGIWHVVSWQEALEHAATVLRQTNPAALAAFVAPISTVEEGFLLQRLVAGLGGKQIDYRLRQTDFNHTEALPKVPVLGMSLAELEQQEQIILIGANTRHDLPLLNHRIRKAALKGAQVFALNVHGVEYNFAAKQQVIAPQQLFNQLLGLVLALSEATGRELPSALQAFTQTPISDVNRAWADQLRANEKTLILVGQMAVQHPAAGAIQVLAHHLASLTGARVGVLPEANGVGLSLAGVWPKTNVNTKSMLAGHAKTIVLLNAELEDFSQPQQALKAFETAQEVVVIAPYADEQTRRYATVLLPAASFAETAGTFVNIEGRWQSFKGAAQPYQAARPAWKILRVLGNQLNLASFDYISAEEIAAEVRLEAHALKAQAAFTMPDALKLPVAQPELQRIGDVPMYRSDAIVRRASALQAMLPAATAHFNAHDLEQLGITAGELVRLTQDDVSIQLVAEADEQVPAGAVWLPSALPATRDLGAAFGSITVARA